MRSWTSAPGVWRRICRNRGVTTGVRVGLCAERSLEMWVGILAIFKCGGICLPLDLSYPAEWVDFVLTTRVATSS